MKKNKPIILIVDDEPEFIEKMSEIIQSVDKYDIVAASSGVEALKVLKKYRSFGRFGKNKIDCILLDIKMEDMNGLEFLQKWRKSESFLDLMPVVILSGYEDVEKWSKATSVTAGMVAEYLKKPIRKDALLDTLDKIIINKEAEFMIDETRKNGYQKREELEKEERAKSLF